MTGHVVPATFVFADLAGYSALTEAHGDESAADTAAAFTRAVRALMADYGGEEVKTIGDALLLRVPGAADALHLAARIVSDQGARHQALGVRVGMHTGNAVCRDGDWFGAAVNLAARIADLAQAGEVLLSDATRQAAGAAVLPGQVLGRGRRTVKNMSEPVELYALVPEGLAGRRLPIDPVCRMAIDPAADHERRSHGGSEYYFCSAGCASAFDRAPRHYAAQGPGRRSSTDADGPLPRLRRWAQRGAPREPPPG